MYRRKTGGGRYIPPATRPEAHRACAPRRIARARRASRDRRPPHRGSPSPAATPPEGRHASRSDPLARGSGAPGIAWLRPRGGVAIGALCRRAHARRGDWTSRSCPRACLLDHHDHRRDPSLPSRCSSRGSALLRSPRTPAAPRSTSPSAYTSHVAPTRAVQTGLSCSVPLRVHVLRPVPRRDLPRVFLRTEARETWPSPRHERLGSRVVTVSRLQASLDVAARGLAPSVEALDTPLGPPGSLPMPGVCYSALRRLPRRDLHPLERNSVKQTICCLLRHDATCAAVYDTTNRSCRSLTQTFTTIRTNVAEILQAHVTFELEAIDLGGIDDLRPPTPAAAWPYRTGAAPPSVPHHTDGRPGHHVLRAPLHSGAPTRMLIAAVWLGSRPARLRSA